jgi:hypothetical protein
MLSRRSIYRFAPMFVAMGALAACAAPGTSGAAVPTLAQVQSWVAIVNSELPTFISESETTGLLTGAVDTKVKASLVVFQTLAGQFLSPTFNTANTAVLVSEIGTALTTVLSVIPATAPFVGFIQLGVLVISAFLATTPIPVPAIPSKASLEGMHGKTMALKVHH